MLWSEKDIRYLREEEKTINGGSICYYLDALRELAEETPFVTVQNHLRALVYLTVPTTAETFFHQQPEICRFLLDYAHHYACEEIHTLLRNLLLRHPNPNQLASHLTERDLPLLIQALLYEQRQRVQFRIIEIIACFIEAQRPTQLAFLKEHAADYLPILMSFLPTSADHQELQIAIGLVIGELLFWKTFEDDSPLLPQIYSTIIQTLQHPATYMSQTCQRNFLCSLNIFLTRHELGVLNYSVIELLMSHLENLIRTKPHANIEIRFIIEIFIQKIDLVHYPYANQLFQAEYLSILFDLLQQKKTHSALSPPLKVLMHMLLIQSYDRLDTLPPDLYINALFYLIENDILEQEDLHECTRKLFSSCQTQEAISRPILIMHIPTFLTLLEHLKNSDPLMSFFLFQMLWLSLKENPEARRTACDMGLVDISLRIIGQSKSLPVAQSALACLHHILKTHPVSGEISEQVIALNAEKMLVNCALNHPDHPELSGQVNKVFSFLDHHYSAHSETGAPHHAPTA